jgi:hypothetical protein
MLGKEYDNEISLQWCSFCPARDGYVLVGSEGRQYRNDQEPSEDGLGGLPEFLCCVPRQGRKR